MLTRVASLTASYYGGSNSDSHALVLTFTCLLVYNINKTILSFTST